MGAPRFGGGELLEGGWGDLPHFYYLSISL
jgi:hypothetical protein